MHEILIKCGSVNMIFFRQQGFLHHLKQKDNSISEINRIVNQQKSMISNLEETITDVRKEKDDLQTR